MGRSPIIHICRLLFAESIKPLIYGLKYARVATTHAFRQRRMAGASSLHSSWFLSSRRPRRSNGRAKPASARSTDPAVQFMEQVGRDCLPARVRSRRSCSPMRSALWRRHAHRPVFARPYRAKLPQAHRAIYHTGWCASLSLRGARRPSIRGEIRIMSPSLQGGWVDGRQPHHAARWPTYDVRWLLAKYGSTYRGATRWFTVSG